MRKYSIPFLMASALATSPVIAQETETAPVEAQETNNLDISGIVRMNTIFDSDGVSQKLPNLIVNLDSGDLRVSGAIKLDNVDGNLLGNQDARLFFLNVRYTGLSDETGTTFTAGVLPPFALTRYPLTRGFTGVAVDDQYALRGGILAVKVDQVAYSDENTNITLNGGIGTKPDWLERFGSSADRVLFAGADISQEFGDVTLNAGVEVIDFQDDTNPSGTDYYGYAELVTNSGDTEFRLYAEGVTGERCVNNICNPTDRYSLTASAITPLSTQTDWQVAAGLVNGEPVAETSVFHNFGDGWRGTAGVGHNFSTDNTSARVGLIHQF